MAGNENSGRHHDFTEEKGGKILHALAHFVPVEIFCTANFIAPETLYNWLSIGEIELKKGIMSSIAIFTEAYRKLEQSRIIDLVGQIISNKAWQAKAWVLERRVALSFGLNADIILKMAETQEAILKRLEALEKNEIIQKPVVKQLTHDVHSVDDIKEDANINGHPS